MEEGMGQVMKALPEPSSIFIAAAASLLTTQGGTVCLGTEIHPRLYRKTKGDEDRQADRQADDGW